MEVATSMCLKSPAGDIVGKKIGGGEREKGGIVLHAVLKAA